VGETISNDGREPGWYAASPRSNLAYHWSGESWSKPVPRRDVGPNVTITTDPTTGGPAATPRQALPQAAQKRLKISPGVGCLLVLIGLAVVIALITWMSSFFSAQNNPQKTEESGLATCKELVGTQSGGTGTTTVEGSVLMRDTYKATIGVAGFSKAYMFECRLIWNGSGWTRDILTGHEMKLP
jgi:hypothetical protein